MPNSRNASFRTWGDVLNFLAPYYQSLAQKIQGVEHLADTDLYKLNLYEERARAQNLQRQIRQAIEGENSRLVGQDIPKTTRLPKGVSELIEELRHTCTI